MTLRGGKPVIWPPGGVSDAIDGSEDFEGACSLLTNLIPAQNNRGMVVARPAAINLASLPDFGGGPLTCMLTIGDTLYGMYASMAFPGKDRPFAYNMATNTFLPISGIAAANLPNSQPTTGDWTAPTADQIGTRVLFTHPGFPGGTTTQFLANYPGSYQFYGNTSNGSPTLTGNMNATLGKTGGLPPVGALLIGAGIANGTTVLTSAVSVVNTTGTGTSGMNTLTVGSAAGLFIGMVASGPGAAGLITNIAGTTVTLSVNLTANLTGQNVQFIGTTVTMSANATASANNVLIAVSANGGAIRFGWLDVSSFSTTLQTNTLAGSEILGGGWSPTVLGLQPGMTLSGSGIPAGAAIVNAANVVVTGTATLTSGSTVMTIGAGGLALPNYPLFWGLNVAGQGISPGTFIANGSAPAIDNSYSNVILSQPATFTGSVSITISGGYVQMSAPATATGSLPNLVTVTVGGGSTSAPLWASGDTQVDQLAGTPVFVKQYGGSACFGINTTGPATAGVTFSDPGVACQVSSASQAITFRNGIPVTAAGGLPLDNQLGGIIQSLIVFQGQSNLQQITGTPALNTVAENTSQVATGTLAPNSIASTPKGLIFAAPDGLRLVDFDGRVSDPIGKKGDGITMPFINAVTPTRMAASFNENVYRITVTWAPPPYLQNTYGSVTRTDEWWLHLDTMKFSGPHTSLLDLAQPWISQSSFICGLRGGQGSLWKSDPDSGANSLYTENGNALSFAFATVLLPDDASMTANSLVESSVFASMTAQASWLASAIDDEGVTLDQAYVSLGAAVTQSQLPIYWHNSVVFRQMSLHLAGPSEARTLIGTIQLRYQKLNYPLVYRPDQQFILGDSTPGADGAVFP